MNKQIFRETDGIRGKIGEGVLTKEGMHKLGRAIGRYFRGGKVLIGRDTRESGGWIVEELSKGINEAGGEVWDIGETTTPCVGILTKYEPVVGGVMVTASHNPASENGVKVFGGAGEKLTDEEELEIEKLFLADGNDDMSGGMVGQNRAELIDNYVDRLVGSSRLVGWKICVDSAAGGGYHLAQKVFGRAGAEVVEVGPAPDGNNINDNCGALHPDKLADEVVKQHANMGVALDGDGDRLVLVDDRGEVWDGDRVTAAIALWMKEKGRLTNNVVVMTEYSNLGAVRFLEKNGIRVEKVLNGDRAVTQKCKELGAVLGGEVAGHVIYPEWMGASDGLFAAMLVAGIMLEKGKKMSEMMPGYVNFPSKVWNVQVVERKPLNEIRSWGEELFWWTNFLGEEGRTFARYSGTEDLLRILVEAKDVEKMEEVGEALSKIVRREIGDGRDKEAR